MRSIAIYGASGFGREVMPLVRAGYGGEGVETVFVDDGIHDGSAILSFEQFLARPATEKLAAIAIADSRIREKLARRCADAGIAPVEVRAANVQLLDDVEIGEGAILCGFASITSTIRIGRFFHANVHTYVAHDCVIGDFVTLAPGVRCNGNVHLGDHAYIGSGAVLKQGLRIGRGAVVGMGAIVTRDVPPGVTVVGNPARPMTR